MSAYEDYERSKKRAIGLLQNGLDEAHSALVLRERWDEEEEGHGEFDQEAFDFIEEHVQEAIAELEDA